MNVKSKALRVTGTVFGVLLSIALVIVLICSLIFSVTASMTKPQTIVTLVKEYSIVEQVMQDSSVTQALEQEGVPTELINDLINSPFIENTIEAYTEDVVAALQGKQPDVIFDENTIKQLAADNMDSLVALVKKHTPEGVQVSDKEIEGALTELTGQYADTLAQAMPSGEQIKEMLVETEIQKPAELLVSTTVPIALYVTIGVLAAIIFVCLLHKFRGLLCLGIDALIAALILLVPYLVLNNDALIGSLLGESAELAIPLINVLSTKLGIYLIVLSVVGVAFIAGFIAYRVLVKKKAAAAAVIEGEAVEPTPEAIEMIEAAEIAELAPTEEV